MTTTQDSNLKRNLNKYITHLNKQTDKKWYMSLASWATISGIVIGLFGLLDAGKTRLELKGVNLQLISASSELSDKTVELKNKKDKLESTVKKLNQKEKQVVFLGKANVTANNNYKKTQNEINKNIIQLINLQKKTTDKEYNYNELQSRYDTLELKATKTSNKLTQTQTSLVQKENKLKTLESNLGNLKKFVNQKGDFSSKLLKDLLSVRTVVTERDWFNFISPYTITIYLDYPDFFKEKIAPMIVNVTYETDIKLNNNEELVVRKKGEYGNKWVATYVGSREPNSIKATVKLKTDDDSTQQINIWLNK